MSDVATSTSNRGGSWLGSPLVLAVLGLIGTGIGALWTVYTNLVFERHKFESSLIEKALVAPSTTEAAKRLRFLIKAGLVPRLNEKNIDAYASEASLQYLPLFEQPTYKAK